MEILDDVTRIRYEECPDAMPPIDNDHSTLLRWYRNKYGTKHVPPRVHHALNRASDTDDKTSANRPPNVSFPDMIKNMEQLQDKARKVSKENRKRENLGVMNQKKSLQKRVEPNLLILLSILGLLGIVGIGVAYTTCSSTSSRICSVTTLFPESDGRASRGLREVSLRSQLAWA